MQTCFFLLPDQGFLEDVRTLSLAVAAAVGCSLFALLNCCKKRQAPPPLSVRPPPPRPVPPTPKKEIPEMKEPSKGSKSHAIYAGMTVPRKEADYDTLYSADTSELLPADSHNPPSPRNKETRAKWRRLRRGAAKRNKNKRKESDGMVETGTAEDTA